MILRTRSGNVELRSEFGNSSDIRPPWSGWQSSSGLVVSPEQAFGLPAVSNVIRSAAEVVASLPFMVYREGPVKERAPEEWQYGLLHDRPSETCDSFEFFYDVALSLEATQNAFIQKAKFGGRVYELYVLDPQQVTVRRDRESGRKLFDVYVGQEGVRRDLTSSEILHIRGFSPRPGGLAGVSLLQVHRDPIGAALAMQGFEGDYFRNGAVPPFWFTGARSREHAKEMVDAHNAQHQGTGRQWRAGGLWGEIDVKSLPISMEDMLFVDAKKLAIEDVCRIWRWPRSFAELQEERDIGDRNARMADFLKIHLLPRLRRIERAFAADEDLFWDSGLFGEFLTHALERADFVTRVRGYKDARQGGWITGNEVRELENYPPLEGGDELLQTPTGSAPNISRSNGHEPELERELAAFLAEG
ncbi:MAG TPA: phage portal protein [Thermoplasmata archaeon]|nr:phage portal protein [Thermoplasmata archaeon]